MRWVRCLLLCLAIAPPALRAQTPGDELRVYLMTLGPGDAVWERFGHNAIVVEDGRGNSIAYNWGMFDFAQPGFVPRLMQGRMLYWMAGYDTQLFANAYVQQNRSIWMQELNLTPQQKAALRDFVEWNALEANKFYRYDPFGDNCSTRVRDAIDRALGGQLATALKARATPETFRSHSQRLTYDDVPTYTGMQLAMGNPVDQPLSVWEEAFIPMELRESVRQVRVRDAAGRDAPLVSREFTIFEADRSPLAQQAPNLVLWYLLAGVLLALLLLWLGRGALTRARRIALAVLIGIWTFVTGFFGTLITMLWALTDHAATYYNENVLQAHPLLLALAVLAPLALLKARANKTAARIALVIAGLSVLGFLLQVFPHLDQVNGEIIALLMPVHIAIAYVLANHAPGNTRLT